MSVIEFYNDYYGKALKSKAHSEFCKRVYGVDLCQHGMADDNQIKLMIRELRLNNRSKVLDLGCGPGRVTNYIQQVTGCDIVGVDISETAIASANSEVKRGNGRIQFLTGDMEEFDPGNNRFDAILSIDSHYFIEDFLSFIPKCISMMTKDGHFAIFSDQGKGISGLNESSTQPPETIIGEYLFKSGIPYKGIRLFEENQIHWKKKKEVLLELKDEFFKEGNISVFENRMNECVREDRTLDGRYLFIIGQNA